ncbi:MAG: hypothetical protein JSV21_02500 [Nitrospirota bacterium]|nr:MAG: hypothetical protein JSV21_02500 [Nitrospirota bacterium]
MKVLYLITRDPDDTLEVLMSEHGSDNEVISVDLRGLSEFGEVLDLIESSDKVISW